MTKSEHSAYRGDLKLFFPLLKILYKELFEMYLLLYRIHAS